MKSLAGVTASWACTSASWLGGWDRGLRQEGGREDLRVLVRSRPAEGRAGLGVLFPGFVLTQTVTWGESLADYGKFKNNTLHKSIPAQAPTEKGQTVEA